MSIRVNETRLAGSLARCTYYVVSFVEVSDWEGMGGVVLDVHVLWPKGRCDQLVLLERLFRLFY